jgi:glycerophosphoryl diester phosphodiesterase
MPTEVPTPIVIAHRGASAYAPEHTFFAWDLALEMGADYLEQDLQMTADGELVVLHDDTLERTARGPAEDCTGAVQSKTLAQLSNCDVGSWFNDARPGAARPEYAGARVASLREVIERYRGRAGFYIETKQPEQAPGMEEKLVQLLREFDLLDTGDDAARPAVFLQSFSPESLLKLRALAPEARLIQLVSRRHVSELPGRLDEIAGYADGIGPHRLGVDGAVVAAAHSAGLLVHPYTVNAPTEMRRLREAGVDGWFSDHTDVARQIADNRP